MNDHNFPGNLDIEAIEKLYLQFKNNPSSLDKDWISFFRGFDLALEKYPDKKSSNIEQIDKEFKVLSLIENYRKRGHLFTKTNPVRTRRRYTPTLDIENFGLSRSDLDKVFQAGKEIKIGPASLREIIKVLEDTYCRSIGAEFMFIRIPDRVNWLLEKVEYNRNKTEFSVEEKKKIFSLLNKAVGFEQFIHKSFIGQKRFSLEGNETLIPALQYIIEAGSVLGIEEFAIGMAHRGRLNVLANIIKKPYENIFHEFTAEAYDESVSLGDVKYHLGYGNSFKLENGNAIELHLAPNPSHLEAVSPVIEGIARARIDQKYAGDFSKLAPILIHGDSAIAGQGVVYEVIQMMELNGYKTGGTIHIVTNNQVGFTTNYLDARSSTYCTDIAKVTKCPIFHVNGDDVEALIHTVKIALQYRQIYQSDVFIDILGYRRHGHNEGDEPRYTQPVLYKVIANHPDPREIYAKHLIQEKIYTKEETEKIKKDFDSFLEDKLNLSRQLGKVKIQQFLQKEWSKYKYPDPSDFDKHVPDEITKELLQFIGKKICYLPENEKFISKTIKLVNDRKTMLDSDKVDWALGELLAYGTLVYKGHSVRVSGQDSIRGTFAHRHASHVIENTDMTYTALSHISPNQAPFNIFNSPLNEYGVLGFEYGYSLATPNGLTIWEAQFGDFHNVAQVIIDQYISSAEEKWGLMNGLVMFLPHGFEGQGPEHSSARVERFLSLASNNNMQIAVPTTPANLYHLLMQQVLRNFRVPLIIFTPKSLLRHPSCISSIDELTNGQFKPVIADTEVDIDEVRRVVFCSGKIYYDLVQKKKELDARDLAIVRIEQLHPFPKMQVESILRTFKNNLLTLWVQEEPINMGAWYYVRQEMCGYDILPVARLASGSPATGLVKIHNLQQQEIIGKIFRPCTCELKRKYCGLQCKEGSKQNEILKQYRYFLQTN